MAQEVLPERVLASEEHGSGSLKRNRFYRTNRFPVKPPSEMVILFLRQDTARHRSVRGNRHYRASFRVRATSFS